MTETIPPAKVKPGEMHGTASHLRVLCRCLGELDDNDCVIEYGCGYYSTPVIAVACILIGARHVIVEPNPKWRKWLSDRDLALYVSHHDIVDTKAFLALVDSESHNGLRQRHWESATKKCDVIILHDANRDLSEYDPHPDTFKYRYLDDSHENHTLVVSNVVDVAEWFK